MTTARKKLEDDKKKDKMPRVAGRGKTAKQLEEERKKKRK